MNHLGENKVTQHLLWKVRIATDRHQYLHKASSLTHQELPTGFSPPNYSYLSSCSYSNMLFDFYLSLKWCRLQQVCLQQIPEAKQKRLSWLSGLICYICHKVFKEECSPKRLLPCRDGRYWNGQGRRERGNNMIHNLNMGKLLPFKTYLQQVRVFKPMFKSKKYLSPRAWILKQNSSLNRHL